MSWFVKKHSVLRGALYGALLGLPLWAAITLTLWWVFGQ